MVQNIKQLLQKQKNIAFLIFIMFFVLFSIIYKRNSNYSPFERKLYELAKTLENRNIKSINKIINFNNYSKYSLIYYYTGYDCSICIKNGFDLIYEVNPYEKKENIFVVGTNTNVGRDQVNYDFRDNIILDENQLLRKELKYIYTPVILLVDNSFNIKEAYFPTRTEENPYRNDFIKRLKHRLINIHSD